MRVLQWRALFRGVGIIGSIVCLVLFITDLSWPTPDKLLVFMTLLFMAFSQAKEMLKRIGPVVAIILVYESFRGIVPSLNTHVHYTEMIVADHWLFGPLPTEWLQNLMWHGHVMWYDFVFYGAYMLHFILPLALLVLMWKFHDHHFWRGASTYIVLSFAGFLTFLLFPAAPPWLASDQGFIEPITRVSSHVFAAMGVQDFPSLYNKMSPNPVAAVPSLHAAYAALFAIFIWRYFGRKWGAIASVYPALIWFGTVYMGEHYAIDEILGIVYAVAAYVGVYAFADHVWPRLVVRLQQLRARMTIGRRATVDDAVE